MFRFLLSLVLYAFFVVPLAAQTGQNLLPHIAIYDLELEGATNEAGMVGVSGRMVYEFKGSECEGYATRLRFVTKVEMEDMPPRLSDMQVSNFESADAKEFRFSSKTVVDDEVDSEVSGVAKIANGEMLVDLQKPAIEGHVLVPAQFPTLQTKELIKKALAGKHFYHTTLYDGTEDADEIIEATVVIGTKKNAVMDAETKVMGALAGQSFWPVTVSHFNDSKNKDGMPSYRASFLLYENGVTRNLYMDYGDFSIRGRLKQLRILNSSFDNKECH